MGATKSFPNGSADTAPQGLDSLSKNQWKCFDFCFSPFCHHGPQGIDSTLLFFGASVTALTKEGGGVRPIAVGCTLRHLVAKVAVFRVRDDITNLLAPRQLGFGITSRAEAAVHAARIYVHDLDENCILKIDFRNAFNMLRRDNMLLAVKDLTH